MSKKYVELVKFLISVKAGLDSTTYSWLILFDALNKPYLFVGIRTSSEGFSIFVFVEACEIKEGWSNTAPGFKPVTLSSLFASAV